VSLLKNLLVLNLGFVAKTFLKITPSLVAVRIISNQFYTFLCLFDLKTRVQRTAMLEIFKSSEIT